MDQRQIAASIMLVLALLSGIFWAVLVPDQPQGTEENHLLLEAGDPLIQEEGHDHKNASAHNFSTENLELLDFNPLTTPGNAEVTIATSPDGRVYAYQAGWDEFHITDVTDPRNTTVMSAHKDPNTQVLDIKYLEYSAREYVITQNQLIDPGYTEPNVGEWGDPAQVAVNLYDVTDKTNPIWVDSWNDGDHPSGPHNLYTHMIDNEWYVFVANPDYEQCDAAVGEACGGVTIAHLNLQGSAARLLPGVEASGLGHTIVKVGEYEVNWDTTRGGWIYIHDMTVQTWPGDDPDDPRYEHTYIYGAYWEAGLRIGDVTDVPHPTNSPQLYLPMATTCKAGQGTPLTCRWRAPEVGQWMDFADLDNDGEPDSGTTGNVNGGRASYIHYAEPFPEMVDTTHLGLDGEKHLTVIAVEVLSTTVGTGLVYLLDTTDYAMENGNMRFLPKLINDWEIPFSEEHCFGADCEAWPESEEWLLFSPHNLDTAYFETTPENDASHGGAWDGRLYISSYHAGVWVVDVETLIANDLQMNRTELHTISTVGYYIPHGADGEALDSQFYEFGWAPNIWGVEHHEGVIYASCISNGLYVIMLDIDEPYLRQ